MEVQQEWMSNKNLPEQAGHMRFNSSHVVAITCYSVLFFWSVLGNCTVLVTILRRHSRSSLTTMIMHLVIADLMVAFLMMPVEIAWAATVSWRAGDVMCRIMAFFRVFGLFLSSFMIVCISIDRYFAVLRPMSLTYVASRNRIMLCAAWFSSLLCSLPQMVVFHVESHPNMPGYEQCVSNNIFPNETTMMIYELIGTLILYGLPLVVIIFTYGSIIAKIVRHSQESSDGEVRRSSVSSLNHAKRRTLKMTFTIIAVFFICWTPYIVMSLWWWLDRESATEMDPRIQKFLFVFACTNSCMNPIVYGVFNIRTRTDTEQVREGTSSRGTHSPVSNNSNQTSITLIGLPAA